jgi:hypothetical protein
MRHLSPFICALVLAAAGIAFAQQSNDKPKQAVESGPAPIPAEAAAKKNPVKSTAEGMADARKLYGYHCLSLRDVSRKRWGWER